MRTRDNKGRRSVGGEVAETSSSCSGSGSDPGSDSDKDKRLSKETTEPGRLILRSGEEKSEPEDSDVNGRDSKNKRG